MPVLLSDYLGCHTYSEVITEQLHDERAVLVAILIQGIQLSDGIIERLQQINE